MKRVIFDNNGTLSDFSVELTNYHAGTATVDYTLSQDSLYIGSRFPFNSLFLKVSSANAVSATMSVSYWSGNAWTSTVELIDETASGGASLAQSGYISWVPNKITSWTREDTVDTQSNELVTNLGGVTIYDLFWIKIDFSATLTNTTALSWVGDLFVTDNDLGSEYPDLVRSETMTAFESGKTSWEEQSVRSSVILIDDLVTRGIISSGDQLLERKKLMPAGTSKLAEIIYNAFGDDYRQNMLDARKEYENRLKRNIFSVDADADARVDVSETGLRQGSLVR